MATETFTVQHSIDPTTSILPWQEEAWTQLTARAPNIPHALLLAGNSGTGKRQFAHAWIAKQLCRHEHKTTEAFACGICDSCHWLEKGVHPAFLYLGRAVSEQGKQKRFITIDQVRELTEFVSQTSEDWRVVMIDPAESLNIAAANALLKTLEEPPPRVQLLLISDSPHLLLPTIRSRVQQVSVAQISQQHIADYVQIKLDTKQDASTLQTALQLTAQAPIKAVNLLTESWFSQRHAWIADWLKLLDKPHRYQDLSEKWQKIVTLEEWLMLIEFAIRDVTAVKLELQVYQVDMQWAQLAQRITFAHLFALDTEIGRIKRTLGQNIQASLIFDALSQQLAV